MKNNIVQEKSYQFAIRIIRLYKHLCEQKKEFVLSKQLLRSGTSIGANIEESILVDLPRKIFTQKFPYHIKKLVKHLIGSDF
jgi:four helix bundle protein